jgi:hypothetical protein
LVDGDLAKDGYAEDDYEMGVALTKGGTSVYEWHGLDKDVWKRGEAVVRRNENGRKTVYELKIPWSVLKIKPVKGKVFGFNFVIFDDDEGAGASYWYQLSGGITNGKRPCLFKKFVLAEGR